METILICVVALVSALFGGFSFLSIREDKEDSEENQ